MLDDTSAERLKVLADKQEIRDVLLKYCRAVDRCDEAALESLYHPGAHDDRGFFRGDASELAKDLFPMLIDTFKSTMHFLGNCLIEVQGDVAYSEAYFIAFHRFERNGKESDLVAAGRYIDRFEKRAGSWKIARRICVHDWDRIDPVSRTYRGLLDMVQGTRGTDDPVYQEIKLDSG